MNLFIKGLFIAVFVGFVTWASNYLITQAMAYGLPILPGSMNYFLYMSGLIVAINIYLKIIIFAFAFKQILAYVRTL